MKSGLLVLTPLRLEAAALRGARTLRTGLGRRQSRNAVERIQTEAADALVVAGVCGAVDERLVAGDVIVASEVRDDAGDDVTCPPSGPLVAALRSRGLRVFRGPIYSSPRLLSRRGRAALRPQGVLAVDMESRWLAAAASSRPFAVVRVVADNAGRAVLDPRLARDGLVALRALGRVRYALDDWAAAIGERQVLVAAPRSFCAGVERAIEIVERALAQRGAPIYVRKQIVHNTHVVSRLERLGAVFVDDLEDVPRGATVVFSAHGVAPALRDQAAARELAVIDATCPLVAKVHAEARRFASEGATIFLIGHANHEEVEGTSGEAPSAIRVVESLADVDRVEADDAANVAYLTQTTLAVGDTTTIVEALRGRFPALRGPAADDICYATHNRQRALKSVASRCDTVLVVGSTTSSNSNRLVEVAQDEGVPAYLLDDADHLDPAWLVDARRVGITAGASAPDELVTGVIDAIASLGPVTVTEESVGTESVRFKLPRELR